MQTSLGWVARNKLHHGSFGGYGARCKVFSSKRLATKSVRRRVPDRTNTNLGLRHVYRWQTDEEVLADWDVVEVFATFP